MAFAVGGGGGAKADINVTPLIDVLLVLLIIFMVITPLTPHGLDAIAPQPPDKQHQQQTNERTVVIEVFKDRRIEVNSGPIAELELQQRLTDIFKSRAEKVVFIKGDPTLDFSVVAHIIDIAKGAQIEKIGLMTPKIEAGS